MSPNDMRPERAQPMWTVRRNDVHWACDLTFHGEPVGWEVTVRRDGQMVGSRIFRLQWVAVAYADSERDDVERGWRD